jgi:hypothetical protein
VGGEMKMKNKKCVPNPAPPKGHLVTTQKNYEPEPVPTRNKKGVHIVIVFVDGELLLIKGFTNGKKAVELEEDSRRGQLVMAKRYVDDGLVPPNIHIIRCMIELNGGMTAYPKGTEGKSVDIIAPHFYYDEDPNRPKTKK